MVGGLRQSLLNNSLVVYKYKVGAVKAGVLKGDFNFSNDL